MGDVADDAYRRAMVELEDPEPCPTCNGDCYIGTGYSDSFVDSGDAMECPTCKGTGVK